MKVALIYNQDMTGVINTFGMQNKEFYNPKTVKKVADSLEKGGHNVSIIDGNINLVKNLQTFMPKVMEGERLGMVFNMAYGIQGESRYTHIPSWLEMLGIPYVGSSPSGHALALDKVITKIIMQRRKIPTPDFWVFSSSNEDLSEVRYPVIVKPKMEAVSYGLKIVDNEKDLKDAIDYIINEFNQQALVEQFIKGREFAVGLIGNEPIETFPVLEIDLEGNPNAIQTTDDKKNTPRNKICPADIPDVLAKEMQKLSIKAFQALQLRDFARVDIRLDENNQIYLLEINSMASMGTTGSYVHAAEVYGLDYTALANKILEVASKRYFANSLYVEKDTIIPAANTLPVRVRSYLRTRQVQAENLLKEVVDLNTHVRNIDGVNHFGSILKKFLTSLEFSCEVFPQVEIGNILFFTNTDSNDYDILLLGNLDNNTSIDKHEYFEQSEQRYFGTGIWEHKGGIISLVLALQSLRHTRLLRKTKIGILLTTDDSLQGRISKPIIMQKSSQAKFVLGLHGAFLNGGIVTSRSGSAVYKCIMNLRSKDNSKLVSEAISSFTRLITSWTELSNFENGIVCSPSEVHINSNITEPFAHAKATLSIRYNKNSILTNIDKKVRAMIPRKHKKQIQFQLEGGIRRPAMEYNDRIDKLWKKLSEIAAQLDIRLLKEHRWSSADLAFVDKNKYQIDGLGPIGIKEHQKTEYILKHSLIERSSFLAVIIRELNENMKL